MVGWMSKLTGVDLFDQFKTQFKFKSIRINSNNHCALSAMTLCLVEFAVLNI